MSINFKKLIFTMFIFFSWSAIAVIDYDQNVTNNVIFGSGNSNGAFTTDRRNGVEVALRAKIPFVGTNNSNGDGTYSFTLDETIDVNNNANPRKWNFEFSVNTDFDGSTGNNIDQYTYELGIDGDPGDGTNFLLFDPITPTVATPFFDHSIGDNDTIEGGGLEIDKINNTDQQNTLLYSSLISNNNLLQQSWRHAFFPFPPLDTYQPEAAGTYDVYLIVKLAGVEVARTDIKVLIEEHNVTPDVIFGSGNANGDFTIKRNSNVEVGLRAKIPFLGLTNYDGENNYSFTLDETNDVNDNSLPRKWNFDFSVNTDFYDPTSSGNNIDDYTYEIGLDADPSNGTNYLVADPITPAGGDLSISPDHSFGNNTTANGGGVEPAFPLNLAYVPLYSDENHNVVQNSSRYAFFDTISPIDTYDPDVPGTYDIYLLVKLNGVEVVRNDIKVLIGGGAPNSAPVTTADTYDVDEDMTLTVIEPNGVLNNDSDVDTDFYGDTLSVVEAGVINADGAIGGSITMASNGTFTYTPPLNFNGDATFSFNVTDGLLQTASSLTITVNPINDAPITVADTNTTNEDTAIIVNSFPNGVLANDSDVEGTSLSVVEFGTIVAVGSIGGNLIMFANGTYQYTPPMDFFGTAIFNFNVSDGVAATPSSLTITVNSVNDEPSFIKGPDDSVLEDAGAQTLISWASAISAGPSNESTQTLLFNVSNDNNALFSSQPAITANGELTYTPDANANGTATVTVSLSDSGGILNGGDNTSAEQTFDITVLAVNDAPSFDIFGNVFFDSSVINTVNIANYASNIIFGPANESSQSVELYTVTILSDSQSIINTTTVDPQTGELTIVFNNTFGTALMSISLQDDGGTDNNGENTSTEQFFYIANTEEIFNDSFEELTVIKSFNQLAIDLINTVSIDLIEEDKPYFDSNNNDILFMGHKFHLQSDNQKVQSQLIFHQWMNEVMIFENVMYY
jgi:VCBS repeat-containing protein